MENIMRFLLYLMSSLVIFVIALWLTGLLKGVLPVSPVFA